jgi:protein phosphatase
MQWVSAAASDPGRVRQGNEDAYLDRPDIGLWAVADGMGGHDLGDMASRLVIRALETAPPPEFLGRAVLDLRCRLDDVNQHLRAEAARRRKQIIGSTIAALLSFGGSCVLLWAGDSRIYRLRRTVLQRLSHDHSRVEELVSQGLIARDAAESHPAANIVTRAVGAGDVLDVDAQLYPVNEGDRFLLCTDGLTKEISEPEILTLLSSGTAKQNAQTLVRNACERGARDNVTVVVVHFCMSSP